MTTRLATPSEARAWEAAYRKIVEAHGFAGARPRDAAFLRASTHFGFPVSCGASPVSDAMRLEALAHGNLSGISASTSDSRAITGLCLPYEKPSTAHPGGGTQIMYAKGALTKDLREYPNKKIYFESGYGRVLGSVQSGTGRIWEDAQGLHFECIVPPTTWGDDLLVSMRRGDTKESGATTVSTESHWETHGGARVRVITAASLFFVGVLNFPVFDSTTAKVKPDSLAAAVERLSKLSGGVYGSLPT
ncbi:MAG: family phage prohead protease [Bryobacterales bacterium]|nr:family phage prohead protease [Bryobacterales bacterium]